MEAINEVSIALREHLKMDKILSKDTAEDLREILGLLEEVPDCEPLNAAVARLHILLHMYHKISTIIKTE